MNDDFFDKNFSTYINEIGNEIIEVHCYDNFDQVKIYKTNKKIEYLKNTYYHRIDGPAIISLTGRSYWINGTRYIKKEDWFRCLTKEQQIKALLNPENFDE